MTLAIAESMPRIQHALWEVYLQATAFPWFLRSFRMDLNVRVLRTNHGVLFVLVGYTHGGKLEIANSSSFNFCFGYLEEENHLLVVVKLR